MNGSASKTYKELTLGMTVRCQDGEVGRLERLIADPLTHEPAHLVVRRGRLSSRDTVIPVSLVYEVTGKAIVLNTTLEAIKTLPDYEVTVKNPEPAGAPRTLSDHPTLIAPWVESGVVLVRQRTVPEHTFDIRKGMTVLDPYGTKLGEVDGVIMDTQERKASHLVLHQGLPINAEHRLISVDLIDFVVRSDIYLLVTGDHIQGFPIYQPNKPA